VHGNEREVDTESVEKCQIRSPNEHFQDLNESGNDQNVDHGVHVQGVVGDKDISCKDPREERRANHDEAQGARHAHGVFKVLW